MDTYELKELELLSTPDFVYEYPEGFSIQGTEFKHIGYGLYMVTSYGEKGLCADDVEYYHNLHFVSARTGKMRWREETILFAYSKKYSTWDTEALYNYITAHWEELLLDEDLRSRCVEIASGLADEFDNAFHESNTMYRYSEKGEPIYVEEEQLDTPFQWVGNKKDNRYVMLNGKIGTKIAEGIYQFKDPLKYRQVEMKENYYYGCRSETRYLPEIGYGSTAINGDWTALYVENWEGGSISILESLSVAYLLQGNLTKEQKEFRDAVGLYSRTFESQTEEEKKAANEAAFPGFLSMDDLEACILEAEEERQREFGIEFSKYNCWEVFKGKGFAGSWKIEYRNIFDFNSYAQKKEAELCGLTEDGVCYSNGTTVTVLPYHLLRYLRISFSEKRERKHRWEKIESDYVGHTFIEESDAREIELLGEKAVEYLKLNSNLSVGKSQL